MHQQQLPPLPREAELHVKHTCRDNVYALEITRTCFCVPQHPW